MNSYPFVINVMPSDDRRECVDYRSLASAAADEGASFGYTLVTVGDGRLEPWSLAQYAMERNKGFSPMIAVNPIYQHPVLIAKKIVTLQHLYPNRLAVNLVTGSFFKEMKNLGYNGDFIERRRRVEEFIGALLCLLETKGPCTYEGPYHQFYDVQLYPRPKAKVDVFVSGSPLEDGALHADNIHYIRGYRPWEKEDTPMGDRCGLAFGVCARHSADEAREALAKLFPQDRKGQMLHAMATNNRETSWNMELEKYGKGLDGQEFYSLTPLRNFWSSAPYLVGSYEDVADRVKEFISQGYRFFLMDYHPSDGTHAREICRRIGL